ncbi:hypothetical protein [Agrobacterium cavarae]|uniref:hypothetical protein n=1 Tax=Agrobacterium cavarae TaxID=2528239 RepID=UPI0028AA8246|nr:hypothetical protein [Agrobacterium cavarae]
MDAEGGEPGDREVYDADALEELYTALKAEAGVSVGKLVRLVERMSSSEMSKADLNAYRQGRRLWKRLREEVVPVMHFLDKSYPPEARVRFPLDSGTGDAFVWIEGQKPIGLEVTGALARNEVEVARNMAEKGVVAGFLGLQDNAPQSRFDAAKRRGRVFHSSEAVTNTLEAGIRRQLEKKDRPEYGGFILIVRCSLISSPRMTEADWQNRLGSEASALPFSEVYLVDAASGSRIFRLK